MIYNQKYTGGLLPQSFPQKQIKKENFDPLYRNGLTLRVTAQKITKGNQRDSQI